MSDSIHTIHVNTDPAYDVSVGPGLLGQCGQHLAKVLGKCRIAVIADSTVAPLYLDTVTASLRDAGFDVSTCIYPAGEEHKNLSTLSDILETLAEQQLTRSDCVAALGGGVCGDMSGFAAGCYLRGIRYVQLPTTLLSAVDSSVGGKTAIDLKAGKNLAGVFLQPAAVLCDTDCLATLTPHTFADGAAEAIKTGVLCSRELFDDIARGALRERPRDIIARCIAFKGRVVEEDPLDNGIRRTLNLGHTVGHAIEKCANFTISHGHAVAIGMVVMAKAAEKLGWCSKPCSAEIAEVLRQYDLPTSTTFSAAQLAAAAASDKKRRGGDISIVVPEAIGRCVMRKVPVSQLESIFAAGLED